MEPSSRNDQPVHPDDAPKSAFSMSDPMFNEMQMLSEIFVPDYPLARVPRDGVLYHYTSAENAIRILQGGNLWMTALHHLNDPREFGRGSEVVQTLTSELRAKNYPAPAPEFLSLLSFPREAPTVFVAAFSEDPESLPQWRTYGDDGAGVAIGFELGDFYSRTAEEGFQLGHAWLHLMKVQYEQSAFAVKARSLLERVVAHVASRAAKQPPDQVERLLQESAKWTPRHFAPHQIAFKDSSWGYEKEWRLVADDSFGVEKVSLRVSRGRVIRYLADRLNTSTHLPIRRIVLGPLREEDDIHSFSAALGSSAKQVEIVRSTLSYRR